MPGFGPLCFLKYCIHYNIGFLSFSFGCVEFESPIFTMIYYFRCTIHFNRPIAVAVRNKNERRSLMCREERKSKSTEHQKQKATFGWFSCYSNPLPIHDKIPNFEFQFKVVFHDVGGPDGCSCNFSLSRFGFFIFVNTYKLHFSVDVDIFAIFSNNCASNCTQHACENIVNGHYNGHSISKASSSSSTAPAPIPCFRMKRLLRFHQVKNNQNWLKLMTWGNASNKCNDRYHSLYSICNDFFVFLFYHFAFARNNFKT